MKQIPGMLIFLLLGFVSTLHAQVLGSGVVYSVMEIEFNGPRQTVQDTPARDIDFWVDFTHESGNLRYKIHGFFDGDGQGGQEGNIFKVRFCPTKQGLWTLEKVYSNHPQLKGQHQGETIQVQSGDHPGFWHVDVTSPGNRWYIRSDGSHPYIIGNTMYSFLSGMDKGGKASNNDIKADIIGNADYIKKLRFGLSGDHYPNPDAKPFLDVSGALTDWGDHSHHPNPQWFHERVDVAVQTAYEHDLIADLILAGPDREESRSTLRAKHNQNDPRPFLKYIAARYGSYPNVWVCLCNEYEIRTPTYTEEELARYGRILRSFLPYTTPVSVHATPNTMWSKAFEKLPPWNDHQIIQKKMRNMAVAADAIQQTWQNKHGLQPLLKPTINDELSYQGKGDQHSEGDTIESHLGTFLGGGYGTTGEKPGNKLGQYFRGKFNPEEHSAMDNLAFLRETIDRNIPYWKMRPDTGIFSNLDSDFRGMAWPGYAYVLGTNKAHTGIIATLPAGTWTLTQYDIINKTTKVISSEVQGKFTFDSPDNRAVLFYFTIQ